MSFPDPPLSRRAVMRAAGIAPVILLGKKAWAQPNQQNMTAFVQAAAPVPGDQLQTILGLAESQHQIVGASRDRFELVVRALWTHFLFGTGDVQVPDDEKIMEVAYAHTTGEKVAQNVKSGLFDPLGNHYLTNICAYVCGHKAAVVAINGFAGPSGHCDGDPSTPQPDPIVAQVPPRITAQIYKCAWNFTRAEMEQKAAVIGAPVAGGGC